MTKPLKPIPEFANEAEERAFRESPKNDSTEYVNWSKAKLVSFPKLRPSTETISLAYAGRSLEHYPHTCA
jgi:hypothetical protein